MGQRSSRPSRSSSDAGPSDAGPSRPRRIINLVRRRIRRKERNEREESEGESEEMENEQVQVEEAVDEQVRTPTPVAEQPEEEERPPQQPITARQFPPPGTLVVVQGVVHTTDIPRQPQHSISSSSIDVLGTLLSVAAAATAASLLTGSSEPIQSSGLAPPPPPPPPDADRPTSPTPTAGIARNTWGSIRDRLGLRQQQSEVDARERMLADMARAFNMGMGIDAPPQQDTPPEGSFERFLVDLQGDLRVALTSPEDHAEVRPQDSSQDSSGDSPQDSSPDVRPEDVPLPEDEEPSTTEETATPPQQNDTGRINWWRLYRFPAIPTPRPPTETPTEDNNVVVPVIIVGLQSVNVQGWPNSTSASSAPPPSASPSSGETPLHSFSPPRSPTTSETLPSAPAAGSPGSPSLPFEIANPGTRTFLIYVIGGYYPPEHTLTSHPPNAFDSFEALLDLADLLGQVKPPTVTKDEIERSGLEVLKAEELTPEEGKVRENCLERCLICLDEYEDTEEVRILKCKHAFHKGCVDKWLQVGRNCCPACRGKGVEPQVA